jgi:hypothetical protein
LPDSELIRFEDVHEDTLSWIRPNFFELRFDLTCSAGVLVRLKVHGIGADRRVLAETAEATWRLGVFPLQSALVNIYLNEESDPIGYYRRGSPVQIQFEDGASYEYRIEEPFKRTLLDQECNSVFTTERAEYFPRWKLDVKLAPNAVGYPHFAELVISTCCVLVFDGTTALAVRRAGAEQAPVEPS